MSFARTTSKIIIPKKVFIDEKVLGPVISAKFHNNRATEVPTLPFTQESVLVK